MLNRYDSLFNLLQVSSRFDLRQEWLRLANSTRLGSNISFAEFEAAFGEIQKGFVRSPDMSPWRWSRSTLRDLASEVKSGAGWVSRMSDRQVDREIVEAVRCGKLVVWPGDRVVVEKVATARACRVAGGCRRAPTVEPVFERKRPSELVVDKDREAGTESSAGRFKKISKIILRHEGGYVDDASDTGGQRNMEFRGRRGKPLPRKIWAWSQRWRI